MSTVDLPHSSPDSPSERLMGTQAAVVMRHCPFASPGKREKAEMCPCPTPCARAIRQHHQHKIVALESRGSDAIREKDQGLRGRDKPHSAFARHVRQPPITHGRKDRPIIREATFVGDGTSPQTAKLRTEALRQRLPDASEPLGGRTLPHR